jgi:tripartite-type tricarboxylate transporter receptor subunit TctC
MPDLNARGSFGTSAALTALILCITALGFISTAPAQDGDGASYPSRPIHIIVPFPAGGPTDILSRIVGHEMAESWGKPVLVENRPGADTAVGAEVVAKANPDGYTLLAAMDSTMVLNPLVKKELPYDPLRDFQAISLGAKNMSLLEVRADSSVENVQGLLDLLKAKPGKLNFGAGTTNGRLAALLFGKLTNTSFAIIPYKGSADTLEGLLTGSIDFAVDGVASSYPLVKQGRFRALAKLSERPFPQSPDLPPLAEAAGIPELGDVSTWIGFYAPAGTSSEIVGKIQHFIATIYADPGVAQRLDDAGIIPVSSTPGDLNAYVRSETERWGKVLRESNFAVE